MVKKDIVDPTEAIRRDALAAVTAQQNAKPAYAGTYEDQLSQIYDKIQNREPFKYDVNADPLYQQYKDQYIQGGKLAMKDTMGQAAALTGGYGSTYGQQVGQQAYDAYLQNLSAAIPELYGMAYNMYKDQGDDLLKQYGLAGERADTEYSRYRDALSDWNYQDERDYNRKWNEDDRAYTRRWNENDRAYNRAWNEDDRAYSRAWNEEDRAYTRGWNEDNRDYTRQQTDYSNLIALIRASGYVPTQEELEAAGLSLEAARALIMDYLRSNNLLDTPYGDSLLDLLSGDTSTDSTQSTEEAESAQEAGSPSPGGGPNPNPKPAEQPADDDISKQIADARAAGATDKEIFQGLADMYEMENGIWRAGINKDDVLALAGYPRVSFEQDTGKSANEEATSPAGAKTSGKKQKNQESWYEKLLREMTSNYGPAGSKWR